MKGRRVVYLAAALVAVAGVLLLAGPAGASRQVHAAAATNVHCGDTINTSITMNGYLDCSAYTAGAALTITSPGVTLDLGGHTIFGNSGQDVIYADGVNDWTVQNGTISGGNEQIYVEYSDNVTAQNLTLTGATDDCIDTYSDAGTVFANNTCSNYAYYGYYSEESAGSVVSGNVFTNVYTNDADGIYLDWGENGDVFSSNYVSKNAGDGIDDYYSDRNTFTGNIVSGNQGDGFYMEYDYSSSEYTGSVTVVNNASRSNGDDGWDTEYLYNNAGGAGIIGPYSTFSGNIANYNVIGFDENDSYGATWSNNYAARNSSDGFYIEDPARESFISNSAKQNGGDGFYLSDAYPPYDPLSFSNNTATYNAGYGFEAESDYPVAGSGNAGGGTNTGGDCYLLSGCS